MTPQDLSIADLKAVIDYAKEQLYYPKMKVLYYACVEEFQKRVLSIHPPTEPKTEEK